MNGFPVRSRPSTTGSSRAKLFVAKYICMCLHILRTHPGTEEQLRKSHGHFLTLRTLISFVVVAFQITHERQRVIHQPPIDENIERIDDVFTPVTNQKLRQAENGAHNTKHFTIHKTLCIYLAPEEKRQCVTYLTTNLLPDPKT